MLYHFLREKEQLLIIEPVDAITEKDIAAITEQVDAYLSGENRLKGILVHTQKAPGWKSLGAMVKHLQFIDEHHRLINKVALVTDSILGKAAAQIGDHFLNAEVRQFSYDEYELAESWLLD